MLERLKTFEHERERQHLGKSRDLVFKNTNKGTETILRLGTETGTQFEAHSMLALKGGDQIVPPTQIVSVEKKLFLGCSSGSLELITVQPFGKKAMSAMDWFRGLRQEVVNVS